MLGTYDDLNTSMNQSVYLQPHNMRHYAQASENMNFTPVSMSRMLDGPPEYMVASVPQEPRKNFYYQP